MVTAQAVSRWFRAPDPKQPPRVAVHDINFAVGKGECIALLGPSGCGKTTLLRMAAGLLRPSAGGISIAGRRVERPERDRCFVFQNFGLLPWRSVLDNVAFPLELDRVPPSQRRERAAELVRLVGLSGYESNYPHEISGGMQQRDGIARALVRGPLVLLMDEPFGALDSQTREQLQEEFLRIWEATRPTVMLVTHAIDEAILLAQRIVVMTPGPGRIKQIVTVPFPMAGRDGTALRRTAEFYELSAALREELRQ